jgi:hypothetical protein
MIRLFGAKGFSKMFLASSQSETYSLFCNKVYGRDLCQANMLDEDKLPEVIQKKYDAIIMIDSLYFVSDLEKCVASLKSLLKPNG